MNFLIFPHFLSLAFEKLLTVLTSLRFMTGYEGFFSVVWSNRCLWSSASTVMYFTQKREKKNRLSPWEQEQMGCTNMFCKPLARVEELAAGWLSGKPASYLQPSFSYTEEARESQDFTLWLSSHLTQQYQPAHGEWVEVSQRGERLELSKTSGRVEVRRKKFLQPVYCKYWMHYPSSRLNILFLHKY